MTETMTRPEILDTLAMIMDTDDTYDHKFEIARAERERAWDEYVDTARLAWGSDFDPLFTDQIRAVAELAETYGHEDLDSASLAVLSKWEAYNEAAHDVDDLHFEYCAAMGWDL